MRRKVFLAVLIPLCFYGCGMFYSMTKVESDFFNERQSQLAAKTCGVSGYEHGFDEDTNLDYFFVRDKVKAAAAKKVETDLRAVFKTAGETDSIDYLEKITYLHELMKQKMLCYEQMELWKFHTYIKNYLLPAFDGYESIIKKAVLTNYPSHGGRIETKRQEFAKIIKRDLRKLHEVDLWEKLP